MAELHVGDMVGGIYKKTRADGSEFWELVEDKINKVVETKRDGYKYYTRKHFRPLYAEDVDSNTHLMEEAVDKGYILAREVFGLNDITRPFAEKWVKWANENMDKAVSILEA